jgi:hypothetical protein
MGWRPILLDIQVQALNQDCGPITAGQTKGSKRLVAVFQISKLQK